MGPEGFYIPFFFLQSLQWGLRPDELVLLDCLWKLSADRQALQPEHQACPSGHSILVGGIFPIEPALLLHLQWEYAMLDRSQNKLLSFPFQFSL